MDYHQNMDSLKNISNYIPRWLLITASIFFALIIILFAPYWLFDRKYENRIYPGVYVGDLNLAGKTKQGAKDSLNKELDKYYQTGIIFSLEDKQEAVFPAITSASADLSYNIINFNADQTIEAAFAAGRNNFFPGAKNAIKSIAGKRTNVELSYYIDEEAIKKTLAENFSQYEIPAQNAELIMENNNIAITEEKFGKAIDYEQAIKLLRKNLGRLDNYLIQLATKTDYPKILKKNCLNIEAKVARILSNAPLVLIYETATSSLSAASAEKKQWIIDKKTMAGWLILGINQNTAYNEVAVLLNKDKLKSYLEEIIAPEINIEPVEAKFEINNGKVSEFQTNRNGIALDIEAALAAIEKNIEEQNSAPIQLTANEIKSKIQAEDVNNLGIKEIIGIGKSNFAGSPANRRHNIKNGAQSLNGIIIKPDEEFSLLQSLGTIDGAAGYLQELVIKGNKTVPEYGGGLCQIGTTMFRAALDTGLPITMRRNHSYRVSYYEPAGTDATIYDSQPDLKFINDTGSHILIQYKIENNDLYFYFWGTKDGRVVEKTDPKIYNIVKPGPTKLVETVDLEPGKKKCTEKAHNGADAYFDYKVTYANGEIKKKGFSSHYIPWREVCLIGVEKLSASSTPENKN